MRPFVLLFAVAFLSSCGWTGRTPAPHAAGAVGHVGDSVAPADWRDVGGRSLESLIREALENSPSIHILAARVELARANASRLASASWPSVSTSGARQFGERQEFETSGERADVMRYAGLGQLGWEVDFWGRVRQLRKGARQKVTAAEADEQAGRLLVAAEIARLDLVRRRAQAEEMIVRKTLETNDDSVRRLEEKLRAGIIGSSEVDRQRAEGESLEREIEELRRQRRLAELALDRLLGREPGSGKWHKAQVMPVPKAPPKVVKTEVLAKRPDLRAAAARVAATWHLSRAATLDLLPKLQLRALANGRTMRLTPSIDEWIAQFAPTLEVPVWDSARLADAKRGKAAAHIAAVTYREKVLLAFEETAAAITNSTAQASIESSAEASARSLEHVYERTLEKSRNGVVSQLDVLEDQRRALAARRASLRAREARLAAAIDLKKATGG